jgi:hypothetical protein
VLSPLLVRLLRETRVNDHSPLAQGQRKLLHRKQRQAQRISLSS